VLNDTGTLHYEEMCLLRLVPEDVEENDHIRLTVWDSEESSADE
jgi:hypothetical protein